jgi:threonine dehydratase
MNVGAGAAAASPFAGSPPIGPADVKAAAARIATRIRPVTLVAADAKPFDESSVYLACETTQVTGSFEARGAANLALYHLEHGALPEAGTVAAVCGNGNAAVACAWAAHETGSRATVFVGKEQDAHASAGSASHRTARARLMRRLAEFGAEVIGVDGDAEQAARAAADHARQSAALLAAPDNPLFAVGAGTLAAEINDLVGSEIDTVVVSVGGGALLAGTCAALEHTGIRVVPVEPQRSRTLSAALEAGFPVDAPGAEGSHATATPAGDSLGSRRVSQLALDLARAAGCVPVQVTDEEITRARQTLWEQRRIPAEYGAAAAFAAVQSGAYLPDMYERVVVVIGGANTDPATLES